eukprot:SAG11_NODE_2091_length_3842_cov_1.651349_6_plen_100_part_00
MRIKLADGQIITLESRSAPPPPSPCAALRPTELCPAPTLGPARADVWHRGAGSWMALEDGSLRTLPALRTGRSLGFVKREQQVRHRSRARGYTYTYIHI